MAINRVYGDAWVRLTTRGASAANLAGGAGDSILKSMRYILLLRGINVGGKNKVSMNDLTASLEGLGYQDIVTYINSGNIIFDTDDDLTTIKENIAGMLGRFPFTIKHVILTKDEYLKKYLICQSGGISLWRGKMYYYIPMTSILNISRSGLVKCRFMMKLFILVKRRYFGVNIMRRNFCVRHIISY